LKFKVDENLPREYASILRGAGFEADTVSDEKLSGASDSVLSERCCTEDRVLMTLDLDFANVKHTLQNPILESWSFGLSPKTSQRLLLF
jgi:predicted nuclease of predicted toxin-antitoxin system